MMHKYIPINQRKFKYIDPDDVTSINYLALAVAILNPNIDERQILSGLFDTEESEERMQQIDYLRMLGAGTELEHQAWLENFKKRAESKRKYVGAKKIKVINPATGTEEIFNSINSMCEEYDLKKNNVRSMFNYKKSNKIKYRGLILEKL